jgi:diguanylate cyclase (GGDEF)-like protein
MVARRPRLPERLVLEVTEQEAVADYDGLRADLAAWTTSGVRTAVDDTGSGYASLQHAIQLLPDFLKLDRELIQEVDRDRTRQALVRALVTFAREIGASVIAEGVERPAQLAWLRDADVALAQGFLFCRPAPAWPVVERAGPGAPAPTPTVDVRRLAARLASAPDARLAADAAVDHLFRRGDVMPSVYLEEGGRLRCYAQRGLWQVLDGMNPDAGVTGLAFRTGRPQRLDDVTTSPEYLQAIPGVVAELCVPLEAAGKVVGAVNVDSVVALAPHLEDEMRLVAQMLGQRLAELDLASARVRTGLLEGAIGRLLCSRTWADGVAALLDSALDVSQLDSAMLVLGTGSKLEIAGATGPLADALQRTAATEIVQLSELLARLTSCYSTGEQTGRGFVGTEALRRAGARSMIAVPVRGPERRVGMLVVANLQPHPLSFEQIQPLELLGSLGGAVLEAAAALESLREASTRDTLTGIGNHGGFYEQLGACADAARVLVVLDVDHFKRLNDTHGHPAGDAVLRSVAAALSSIVREGDRVFRIGGDEFAVLARISSADAAVEAAEAVLERVRVAVTSVLRPFGTTVSAGMCVIEPGGDAEAAYSRADAELYVAKSLRI